MKKILMALALGTCSWHALQSAASSSPYTDEYSIRAFVSKHIDLKFNNEGKEILYLESTETFDEIIKNLRYIRDQSRAPVQRLFSDLTTPIATITYFSLCTREALDMMIFYLTQPNCKGLYQTTPTFSHAIEEINQYKQSDEKAARKTCLSLVSQETAESKIWLGTFKQKQTNGEISTSPDDLNRELDDFFENRIKKLTCKRTSTGDTILHVIQDLNGDKTDSNSLPSPVDYFSVAQ